MLNNLKIGVRLAIGFAITLALLVVVSVVGVTRISGLNDEVHDLVKDKFPKTVAANDIVDAIGQIARQLRNAYLYSDVERQKSLDAVAEQRKIILDRLDKLDKSITSDKGKDLLHKVKAAREVYVANQDKAIELIKANAKQSDFVALMQGGLRTSLNEYVAAITALNDFQTELVEKDGADAEAAATSASHLLEILAVIALLLTAAIAWLITRSITGPVNTTVAAAKKMAVGDFNFQLSSDSKDEVGEVVRAVASVQQAVQAMTADANRLAKAAVDGRLATRADASKHQGDFQKIVKGVNDTLDSVIGPLNVAANYVDRISKGDIPPKIVDTYNGDFNTLKNNLNQAITAINGLVADANLLAKAAVDGKLATRADASKHLGDYRKIVEGVNQTLDAVIGPLNVAADYVDRISKGNIPEAITDDYNGDFNTIKNNLNACIDATEVGSI